MTKVDPERERQRLKSLYSSMDEAELRQFANEEESLTDIAREVLRAEMSRRGIAIAEINNHLMSASESTSPVVIRRFRDLPEASIAKSILDSAGIESFLSDDNVVRLDWFYSNLVGGIKLLVREEDAQAASELLSQSVPERFNANETGEYEQPQCPRCHSFDVTFEGLDRRLTYAGLFLGLPIPITDEGWKCLSCKHTWKDDDGQGPSQRKSETNNAN